MPLKIIIASKYMTARECIGKGKWNKTPQWSFTVLNPCDLDVVLFSDTFYTLQEIAERLPSVASSTKLGDFSRGHTKVPNYIKLERLQAS